MVQRWVYKTYIIVALILLLVPLVSAEEYMLQDIEKCIGKVNVIDRTKNEVGYTIKNCDKVADGWDCKCQNNPFQIILEYDETKDYTFDFVVRYYVSVDQNENTERIKSIEGLQINKEEKKREVVPLPDIVESGGLQIFMAVALILIFFIGIIIIAIRWVLKEKGNEVDFMNMDVKEKEEQEAKQPKKKKNLLKAISFKKKPKEEEPKEELTLDDIDREDIDAMLNEESSDKSKDDINDILEKYG